MKLIGNWVRRILYKTLPLETYLSLLSQFYFISFNLGLLKNNRQYAYPYYLKNIVKKGDVCIDIGANLGYITTRLAKLVGPTGKVYAVEPVKPILSVLRKNTKNLKNIEILPYALGEENKSIQIGNNTVSKKGFMASGSHEVVSDSAEPEVSFAAEMKKGSELFSHLDKLDFVKIDIEGYEEVVVPEIQSLLVRHKPILLIESRHEARKNLIQFFHNHGFRCFILEDEKLIPTDERDFWDMLVVPNEKVVSLSAENKSS